MPTASCEPTHNGRPLAFSFKRTFLRLEFRGPCCKEQALLLHAVLARSASSTPESKAAAHTKRVDERTSLSWSWSPSTLAVSARERPRRLAPKALAAEQASKSARREVKGSYGGRPQWTRHGTGPATSENAEELGSGLQPQAQGQQAGTFANTVTRRRCALKLCGRGAELRHGTDAGAGAQLHWHREGTHGWIRQRAAPKRGDHQPHGRPEQLQVLAVHPVP